jgi:hypothetical protein
MLIRLAIEQTDRSGGFLQFQVSRAYLPTLA